jgi:hypothetical protein
MKQMEFRRLNDRHGAGNRVIHKKTLSLGLLSPLSLLLVASGK